MNRGPRDRQTGPQPDTVANQLAREIKRRRIEAGLSQRVLASRIGYSRQYVTMTEWKDAVLPSRELVAALDTGLDAHGALIALREQALSDRYAGRDPIPENGRASINPDIRSVRATDGTLDSMATATRLLASQRQRISPDVLLTLVSAHRDSISALFQSASEERVKNRIGFLLGEVSIVASRLWSAVGGRSMALANCAFARRLADEIRDPILGGTARIFESNLRSDAATLIGPEGDIVDGLRLLGEAAELAGFLPPSARARIAAEQAQAFAVLNLASECREALVRAERAVDQITERDRTGLFSDWSPSRLQIYQGTCWLFLHEPQKAAAALDQAIGATDAANHNVVLAARVDLASAYTLSGELDEGCRILGDAYTNLIAIRNSRGTERAKRAFGRLEPWKNERPVRELEQRIEAL